MDNPSIQESAENLDMQASGEVFIQRFHNLLQIPRIHEADNRLAMRASKEFIQAGVNLFSTSDAIVLEVRHGRLFLCGEKLLMRKHAAIYIFGLLSVFDGLMLSGLKFNYRLKSISPSQAYHFAGLIMESREKNNPLEWMAARLSEPEYQFVEIIKAPEEESLIPHARKVRQALRIYSFAYNSLKDASREILEKRRSGIRKPLRVAQEMVDFAAQDYSILLGLTTIRDYDDYTYLHSVNVAILSICLGHQVGLSENALVFLGVCGFFHDLGKIDIPIEIISKPGALDDEEFKLVQQHSLNSVRQILKLQASSDLVARIVLAPFEHHLKYDLSGYPDVNWTRPISLFGRILEICDVYDALTSPRIYRPRPFSQDRALGIIMEKAGEDFDPILVKWFVNMVGVFPVGTFVILNTGEKGLVCEGGSIENNFKPAVLVLTEKTPGAFAPSKIVNLNRRDPETGRYMRTIKSTHHPSEFGIQPMLYFKEMQCA